MDLSYLHILINHFPILGFVFGVLILATGYILKNDTVKLTSFGLMTFAALMAIPTFLTGSAAEDTVSGLPGVTENVIESHEEAAELALWIIIPVGVISGLAFWSVLKKDKLAKSLSMITLVLGIISTGIMMYVGKTGGEIRHTEFRKGAAATHLIMSDESSEDDD